VTVVVLVVVKVMVAVVILVGGSVKDEGGVSHRRT
jgi:hypothetical protein